MNIWDTFTHLAKTEKPLIPLAERRSGNIRKSKNGTLLHNWLRSRETFTHLGEANEKNLKKLKKKKKKKKKYKKKKKKNNKKIKKKNKKKKNKKKKQKKKKNKKKK